MRLQLTWVLVAAVAMCAATRARADQRVGSWLSVYADSDRLTVVSPQFSGRVDVREGLELELGYEVDVISAASVDVVTAASPRGYDERRQGGRAGLTWSPNAKTRLGVTYVLSGERDYRSDGIAVNASREWIDRRLTTRLDARVRRDAVGRSGDQREHWRGLTTSAAAATLSWIFDPKTIGDVSYEFQVADGFLASPYRFVTIEWAGAMAPSISVPEAVPSLRIRHAVATRVRRALNERWFASLQYRVYRDDWGVLSHTGDIELQRAFAWDRLIVGVDARAYRQSAADFHERNYSASPGMIPAYRSADKMLSGSWSVLAGLRAEARYEPDSVFDAVSAVVKVEFYQQHFFDFAPLSMRRALITSLGAMAEF